MTRDGVLLLGRERRGATEVDLAEDVSAPVLAVAPLRRGEPDTAGAALPASVASSVVDGVVDRAGLV